MVQQKKWQKITTSIPHEIWHIAMLNQIRWTDALILGVEVMVGDFTDENKIVDEIKKKEGEITYLRSKLKEIKKEQEQKEESRRRRIVC